MFKKQMPTIIGILTVLIIVGMFVGAIEAYEKINENDFWKSYYNEIFQIEFQYPPYLETKETETSTPVYILKDGELKKEADEIQTSINVFDEEGSIFQIYFLPKDLFVHIMLDTNNEREVVVDGIKAVEAEKNFEDGTVLTQTVVETSDLIYVFRAREDVHGKDALYYKILDTIKITGVETESEGNKFSGFLKTANMGWWWTGILLMGWGFLVLILGKIKISKDQVMARPYSNYWSLIAIVYGVLFFFSPFLFENLAHLLLFIVFLLLSFIIFSAILINKAKKRDDKDLTIKVKKSKKILIIILIVIINLLFFYMYFLFYQSILTKIF